MVNAVVRRAVEFGEIIKKQKWKNALCKEVICVSEFVWRNLPLSTSEGRQYLRSLLLFLVRRWTDNSSEVLNYFVKCGETRNRNLRVGKWSLWTVRAVYVHICIFKLWNCSYDDWENTFLFILGHFCQVEMNFVPSSTLIILPSFNFLLIKYSLMTKLCWINNHSSILKLNY